MRKLVRIALITSLVVAGVGVSDLPAGADTGSSVWSTSTPLPRALTDSAAESAGTTLYVAGGYDYASGDSAEMYGYSLATHRWRTLPPMPRPRSLFALVRAAGHLYAVGGGGTSVDRYDLATNRWQAGVVPAAPRSIGSAVTVADSGLIYALVGTADNRAVALTYNPNDNRWSQSPAVKLPGGAYPGWSAAAPTRDGHILGVTSGSAVDYDPASKTWTTIAAPLFNEADCSVGFDPISARRAADGRIYILGAEGECESAGEGTLAALGVYDPVSRRWARGEDAPSGVHGQALAWYDGALYAVGGADEYGSGTVNEVDVLHLGADHNPPVVSVRPRVHLADKDIDGLLLDVTAGGLPVRVSGSATDPATVAASALRTASGSQPYGPPGLDFASLGNQSAFAAPDARFRAQMAFSDAYGNETGWVSAPPVTPVLVNDGDSSVHYSGTWHTSSAEYGGIGGSSHYTSAVGASVTFSFTGSSFGWVNLCEVASGSARIFVDGHDEGLVGQDCSNAVNGGGDVLRAVQWWATVGPHTIRIVNTNSWAVLDIDGFAYL